MKLVTYLENGAETVGALTRDGTAVFPLPVPDMNTLIETMSLSDLRSAAETAERAGALRPLAEVDVRPHPPPPAGYFMPRHELQRPRPGGRPL